MENRVNKVMTDDRLCWAQFQQRVHAQHRSAIIELTVIATLNDTSAPVVSGSLVRAGIVLPTA
jgi:hypothetical protein